jgi:hypothetical protein
VSGTAGSPPNADPWRLDMKRDKLENSYLRLLTTAAQKIFPDIRTISGCPTDPEIVIQD